MIGGFRWRVEIKQFPETKDTAAEIKALGYDTSWEVWTGN